MIQMLTRVPMVLVALLVGVNVSWVPSLFGGGPENLVLVVNAESQASLSVANEYIELRNIPRQNVIYLTGITQAEHWDLNSFKAKILRPIFDVISERTLYHVDYIVYSADFPTMITINDHAKKYIALAGVPKEGERIFGPRASINSLTYYARQVLADEPSYIGLTSNLYMRDRSGKLLIEPFVGESQVSFQKACDEFKGENFDEAIELLQPLAEKHPRQVAVQYWLARCYAKQNQLAPLLRQLVLCVQAGWAHRDYLLKDEAFIPFHDNEQFKQLVERVPNESYFYLPTTNFSATDVWGPNGMRNGDPTQGQRYFLSTVLAVTRNRGTTEAEAIENLRQSVPADFTQPKGTFYFSKTNNVRSKTRAMHFDRVSEQLRGLGFGAEIVQAAVPKNKQDILGLSLGTASYRLDTAQLTILPGAIVENLTSFGGVMRMDAKQTPLSACIKAGAAGSSGTVAEPLAIINKFPHPNIHLHYVRGSSLAEAYYQSVHSPCMLLIVGDALCRPWGKQSPFELEGLSSDNKYQGDVTLTPRPVVDEDSQSPRIAFYEFFLNGVMRGRIAASQAINIPTASLPDGFHEMRVVAVADHPLQWRTSVIVPMVVENHGHHIELKIVGDNKKSTQQQFELEISSVLSGRREAVEKQSEKKTDVVPLKSDESDDGARDAQGRDRNSAREIAVFHRGRILYTIQPSSRRIIVDASKLGRGKNELQAAIQVGENWVFSSPVEVEVTY